MDFLKIRGILLKYVNFSVQSEYGGTDQKIVIFEKIKKRTIFMRHGNETLCDFPCELEFQGCLNMGVPF